MVLALEQSVDLLQRLTLCFYPENGLDILSHKR